MLAELVSYCKAKGAAEIYTAILLDKTVERDAGGIEVADFTGLTVENEFVFGYGLDYKGYLRNVPGIYKVAKEHQ